MALFLQAGLPKNAIEGAWSEVVFRVPGNGNPAGFRWMFVLPMTPPHHHQFPTISLNQANDVANRHSHQESPERTSLSPPFIVDGNTLAENAPPATGGLASIAERMNSLGGGS